MKNPTYKLAFIGIFAAQICFGCDSNKENTEEAKSKLMNAATELSIANEKATADSIKIANNAEWQIFKTETVSKIKVQEIRIKELKKTLKDSRSEDQKELVLRIDELERKNESLKKRLDSYGKLQGDWQRFKSEFVQDMDQLGQALKSFTIPRKP